MKLKIGARNLEVNIVEKIDKEGEEWGKTEYQERKIYIKNVNYIENKITLLHEIIHISLKTLGYNKQKEKIVSGLSGMLLQVMRDNKEIIDYLTEQNKQ